MITTSCFPLSSVIAQSSVGAGDSTVDVEITTSQLTHYIAVKKALGPYWETHAELLRTAQSSAHHRSVELPGGQLDVVVFDYPELVNKDSALATIFTTNQFKPMEFEATQLAANKALGVLSYDESTSEALPPDSSALGKNVALVKAHRQELAAVGVVVQFEGAMPDLDPGPSSTSGAE